MTLSGPEMHRLLMEGYKDCQQRLEEMRGQISTRQDRRQDLGDDRSGALVDLAKHYLPELTREAVESSWVEVRESVQQVLLRKEDQRRRVIAGLGEANDRRKLQEDRLLEINRSLDQAKATQDELSSKVETELASDETFVLLSKQAAVAEAALERAEANLDEIGQDAARKLPAYESSALFKYLRDQAFATPQYDKRGFTRRMDRWLAQFIDYHQAKQSYDFLVNTPEQMRKLIAQDRDALDTVMQELEDRRDLVVKRTGLTSAIAKVEQLTDRREKQLIELDETRETTDSLERELTDLEDTRGEYYREAIEIYREMLAEIDPQELADQARRTESITDDQIVARIQGVDDELERLDDDAQRHQDAIRGMQECLKALGRLLQRFRASKFDAARSHFLPSLDILDLLHRAKNEHDIDEAWDRIRKAQRWGPTLGDQLGTATSHPLTQVMIGAMAAAVGTAMQGHAGRAGRRRDERWHGGRSNKSGDSSGDWSKQKKRR